MGKTRKKTAEQFEVLLSGEFYGSHDSWTEYLCLARNPDRSITLTSRAREILAEAARYRERDYLPATIRRREVFGFDGDYVVGQRLLTHDGGAELTVSQNQFDLAARWLIGRKWDRQPRFGEAWARIRSALYGQEFFGLAKPLPLLRGKAPDRSLEEGLGRQAGYSVQDDGAAPRQHGGCQSREIVIRCAGPSKPWITWLELVFIEWSKTSYSVYARTGEALNGAAESPGLMLRTAAQLSWREVLKFVQSHDLATVSSGDPQSIDIYGVQPWHRDVIAAAMMRFSTIVPFLSSLSEKELRSLHERLDGFLSNESVGILSRLGAVKQNELLRRKSLAKIAQLLGSPDPLNARRLAEDCAAYLADRHVEQVLAQHRNTPAPPQALFLSLLHWQRPRSTGLRAGLFELWLCTEPKPKGGIMSGLGHMDNELPVLHWLLREQAAEIFQSLADHHYQQLQEFVSWFLEEARQYARYFTRTYKFDSFVVDAYGRPRFAAWARLAKEVQDAAVGLGIPFSEKLRLPEMPRLEEPTRAFSMVSPVRMNRRRLKRIQDQLFGPDSEKSDGNS